jgi:hypothetical protein
MTRPVVHPTAEQAYRLLPDYMRADDIGTDWTLLRYVAAASVALDQAGDFLTITDPATSVTGTCEIVNAAAAPRRYLPWLGWLVGIDTSALPDPDVRAAILNSTETQRRGSMNALETAIARTLTGSKNIRIYWNLTSTDPYLLSVVTLTSETPDPAASLSAAWTEKPAGIDLELNTVIGSIWTEVVAEYATWNDVVAAHSTWNSLVIWTP